LHTIYDDPFDVVPRRVYADWLEEHGATGLAALQRLWMPDGSHAQTNEWKQGERRLLNEVRDHCPEGVRVNLEGDIELWAQPPDAWSARDARAMQALYDWMTNHHVQGLVLPRDCSAFAPWCRHPLAAGLRALAPGRATLAALCMQTPWRYPLNGLLYANLSESAVTLDHLRWLQEAGVLPALRGMALPNFPFSRAPWNRWLRDPISQQLRELVVNARSFEKWNREMLLDLPCLPSVRTLTLWQHTVPSDGVCALDLLERHFPNIRSLSLVNVTAEMLQRLPDVVAVERLHDLSLVRCGPLGQALLPIAEALKPSGRLWITGAVLPDTRERLQEMLGPRFRHET
jgi:uncharacterized protein (TIGR02996 family)